MTLLFFCTNRGEVCVLEFDSTFNLGPFEYLRGICCCKRRVSPIDIQPCLVQSLSVSRKTILLTISLPLSERPDLTQLHCFGTDGEAALFNTFSTMPFIFTFSSTFVTTLRTTQFALVSGQGVLCDIFGNVSQLQ